MVEINEAVRRLGSLLDASGWGTTIGFIASIVSILGVPFAVIRARQARTAAEAARAAAEQTAYRIHVVDAIRRLSAALTRFGEFRRKLRTEGTETLCRLGGELRADLIEIAAIDNLLQPNEQSMMHAAVAALRETEAWIEADSQGAGGVNTLGAKLTEHLDELQGILVRLRARAVRNGR